jgi:hypothetical protein
MTMGKWARMLLLAVPFLAGCANFWQAPATSSGSGGCTTDCTTASSGDFYVVSSGSTPQISGYSFVSGALTKLTDSPYPITGAPFAAAIAPGGGYFYVSSNAGIYVYAIGTGGALGTAKVVSTDVTAEAIQVDQSGAWLVEALPVTGGVQLNAIPLNSSGGYSGATVLTATFAVSGAAVQPGQLAISEDNSYIFLALGAGGTIVVPFNAAAPFPAGVSAKVIPVVKSGGAALSVAVDPSLTPRLFYIGETLASSTASSGGLRAFNYSSLGASTLTELASSPLASGGLAPNAIVPLLDGDYVYVANGAGSTSAGNIAGFAVSSTGTSTAPVYSLTAGKTFAAGTLPIGLAEDSSGKFMLAVSSSGSPYFDSYTFDATTAGSLDVQVVSSTPASPIAIIAAP